MDKAGRDTSVILRPQHARQEDLIEDIADGSGGIARPDA
jgi:hypothetical protein